MPASNWDFCLPPQKSCTHSEILNRMGEGKNGIAVTCNQRTGQMAAMAHNAYKDLPSPQYLEILTPFIGVGIMTRRHYEQLCKWPRAIMASSKWHFCLPSPAK